MQTVGWTVVVVLILGACAQVQAGGVLSASEVRGLVAGKTLEGRRGEAQETDFDPGTGDAHGERVLLYFGMEGGVVGKIGDNDKAGRWSVSDAGELCLQWEGSESRCAPVHKDGSVYKRVTRGDSGMKLMMFTFSGFADGNVYGLK